MLKVVFGGVFVVFLGKWKHVENFKRRTQTTKFLSSFTYSWILSTEQTSYEVMTFEIRLDLHR